MQSDVNIGTSNSDLAVIYGMFENDDNECIFRVCSDTPGNVDIVKKYFLGNS